VGTTFGEYLKQRAEVRAEDAAFVEVPLDPPSLDPEHTLVVAAVQHKYNGQSQHPGKPYWIANDRLESALERQLVVRAGLSACDYWTSEGRILGPEDLKGVVPRNLEPTPGALQILSGVGYDPGSAAFRLHSAINEHTKHASLFVRWADTNPHCSLRQLDGIGDLGKVRDAFTKADVIHCHVAPMLINNVGIRPRPDQLVIRHYHGSKPNGTHIDAAFDKARQFKLLGARLSLVAEARDMGLAMDWSPIPVPVHRYRALRDDTRFRSGWTPLEGAATARRPFIVAHSPTDTAIKGTRVLQETITALQDKGVPIKLKMIHGQPLRVALQWKALADACFDSFWLGIQGSGLEAGAMEMPVVAGDPSVQELYRETVHYCPYTFANTARELGAILEQLAMDPVTRQREADKVALYVARHHDYRAVARQFEQSVARWLDRTDTLTEV
jgi:hypothetical protein